MVLRAVLGGPRGYARRKRTERHFPRRREAIPLARYLLPSFSAVRRGHAQVRQTIAALRVVEAIRLYGAAHDGSLPAKLADVTDVPIPIDPTTGQPFVYDRTGKTAVLQSPGGRLGRAAIRNHLRRERKLTMRVFASLLFSVLLFVASTAAAGEAFDPAARAKLVAPVHRRGHVSPSCTLDASRVPIGPLIDLLGKLHPGRAGSDVPGFASELEGVRDAFTRARRAGDLRGRQYGRPAGRARSRAADSRGRRKGPGLRCSRPRTPPSGGATCWPSAARTRSRGLKGITPDERPELAAAFEAAGDTAAQALLIPPKYTARVIDEMVDNLGELVPGLPAEIGNVPGTVISQGIAWAALGADVEPKVAVRLVVQSQDEAAAEALHQAVAGAIEFVGKQPDVRRMLPTFDKLAAVLTPKLQGDRLTVSLDEESGGIAAVISAVEPVGGRGACDLRSGSMAMNHLWRSALAMHVFLDQHKRLPRPGQLRRRGQALLSWRVQLLPYLGGKRNFTSSSTWTNRGTASTTAR